jgi:hypothetical protein
MGGDPIGKVLPKVRQVEKAYFALLEEETNMIEDEFHQKPTSIWHGRRPPSREQSFP